MGDNDDQLLYLWDPIEKKPIDKDHLFLTQLEILQDEELHKIDNGKLEKFVEQLGYTGEEIKDEKEKDHANENGQAGEEN